MITISTTTKSNKKHKRAKGEVLIENVLTIFKNSGMDFTYDKACIFLDVIKDYLKHSETLIDNETSNEILIINDDPFNLRNIS